MRHQTLICFALLAALAALAAPGLATAQQAVNIAMVPSLMDDLNKGERSVVDKDFPKLVKEFTGMNGVLVRGESVKDVADKLQAGTAQFGVFQGIEFAEAQAAAKSLKPLLLAEFRTPTQTAVVVGKKDAEWTKVADLKGKDVGILKQGKEHIRRFVAKETGGDPAKFFGKVVDEPNREDLLNAVAAGKLEAAVVDRATVDLYKDTFAPVFNKRLKIVAESEPFPSSVIAYDANKTDPAMVKSFENGMLKANNSDKGREFMSTFRITQFVRPPADFDKMLTTIRTAYPK